MKTHLYTAALLVALTLIGCREPEVILPPHTVTVDDLAVSVEVGETTLVRDQVIKVIVVARNLSGEPIRITGRTGAPVYVRVQRFTGLGWETVKRYPTVATMVMNPWMLRGGAQRRFTLNLRVEPDWPTNEKLRLKAELNGRRDVAPAVEVIVLPAYKTSQ